jgi:hypothetical protein
MSGEFPPEDNNNNDGQNNDAQQDFSEPLDPCDATIAEEPPQEEEEEPEPAEEEPEPPQPQLPAPALPAETPSSANNALIMQIKILQEYAKDIKRSMNSVAAAAGVHHEYVRRAVSNLVKAVVEHKGDIETLQEIYTEGNYSLKPNEIHRLPPKPFCFPGCLLPAPSRERPIERFRAGLGNLFSPLFEGAANCRQCGA